MTSSCHIRPVREGDVEALASTMRTGDVAEVLAMDSTPLDALRDAVGPRSVECWTVELGGEVAAMGGVSQPDPRPAEAMAQLFPETRGFRVVWLLTGAAVDRHRLSFWKASRRVMADLLQRYPLLLNMVDARYEASLRWAQRLGAEVRPVVPVGASGTPFVPVLWRSPWAHQQS